MKLSKTGMKHKTSTHGIYIDEEAMV